MQSKHLNLSYITQWVTCGAVLSNIEKEMRNSRTRPAIRHRHSARGRISKLEKNVRGSRCDDNKPTNIQCTRTINLNANVYKRYIIASTEGEED